MKLSLGKYKLLVMAAVVAAGFLFATPASYAGNKGYYSPYIYSWTSGGTNYYELGGQLGDARNSSNTADYVGCSVNYVVGQTPSASCMFTNTSTSGSCATTDPQFVQLILSVKGDSYLQIEASGQPFETPVCNSIWISNASSFTPKLP